MAKRGRKHLTVRKVARRDALVRYDLSRGVSLEDMAIKYNLSSRHIYRIIGGIIDRRFKSDIATASSTHLDEASLILLQNPKIPTQCQDNRALPASIPKT